MKRDMDLIRKIALWFEEQKNVEITQNNNGLRMNESGRFIEGQLPDIPGFSDDEIRYSIKIMVDGGLIVENREPPVMGHSSLLGRRLSWEGHEFLDAARNDTHWNQAKDIIKEKGGSLTFDIVKEILTQLARQAIGLP